MLAQIFADPNSPTALGLVGALLILIYKMFDRFLPAKPPTSDANSSRLDRLIEMANHNAEITEAQKILTEQGFFSCGFTQKEVASVTRIPVLLEQILEELRNLNNWKDD